MSFALTHALRLAPCARARVDAIFLFILDLDLVDCAVLSKQHQRREEKIINHHGVHFLPAAAGTSSGCPTPPLDRNQSCRLDVAGTWIRSSGNWASGSPIHNLSAAWRSSASRSSAWRSSFACLVPRSS